MKTKYLAYALILGLIFAISANAIYSKASINGVVEDYFGNPIEGVIVKIKNSRLEAITNKEGKYEVPYIPGSFTVMYSKDGYSKHEMNLNLSSKDEFPAEDVTLCKVPESLGVYFYSPGKIVPLGKNRLGVAGTLLQPIPGLKSLSHNSTVDKKPALLVYGDIFPMNATHFNELTFTQSASVQNLMGKTPSNINMWTASNDVPFKLDQFYANQNILIINPKEPLPSGIYALSWGGLHSKDPLTASVSNKSVFDFKIIDPKIAARMVQIWSVGNPHNNSIPSISIPISLKKLAEEKDIYLELSTFPAKGFYEKFVDAFLNNKEPEILAINNWGILDGINTKVGNFKGIRSNQNIYNSLVHVSQSLESLAGKRGGWQFILSTSRNYSLAKSIAMSEPKCKPNLNGIIYHLETNDREEITELARLFYRAYFNRESHILSKVTRKDSFTISYFSPHSAKKQTEVKNTRVCGFFGNSRLAFAPIKCSFEIKGNYDYEESKSIGHMSKILILNKHQESWKILSFVNHLGSLKNLEIIHSELSDRPVDKNFKKPILNSPSDQENLSRFPRPLIEWLNPAGDSVIGYFVESQYDNGGFWSESKFDWLKHIKDDSNKRVIKIRAPFGVGMQPHRWRVWSIDSSGEVLLSNWRQINFTN